MRYGQIREFDVANGVGIRVTLFVTGCTLNCKGCFNKTYWNFQYGDEFTQKEEDLIIKYLENPVISGLTILGGEPFQNYHGLIPFVRRLRSIMPYLNIWIYSGYTYDELIQDEQRKELLEMCDILVDGRFMYKLKDLKLKFRGSSNQRIIDVQQSLKANEVIKFME